MKGVGIFLSLVMSRPPYQVGVVDSCIANWVIFFFCTSHTNQSNYISFSPFTFFKKEITSMEQIKKGITYRQSNRNLLENVNYSLIINYSSYTVGLTKISFGK